MEKENGNYYLGYMVHGVLAAGDYCGGFRGAFGCPLRRQGIGMEKSGSLPGLKI